ncbi:hypothetical protein FRC04_000615 [Tulasnella sp. 424]|nr:hypothetical protein FRC04_000615 [Tulasnella sp. 424]KAG8969149.1 hypothetical protein FRC05_001193 [Tulasnella sp. 425]
MSTDSSSFTTFLTTTFPTEYKSPAPPRLQSLYSDISRQKQSNPEGFQSSIGWWTNALETVVRRGKQPQPQAEDYVVLHATDKLAEALRWEKVGRPIGLGAVLEELAANKTLIALPTFLKSAVSIHYQPSLAYRVAAFVVGRPLWWALSQLPFVADDGSSLTSEQRWKNFKGDYVVLSIVKQAADAIIARQKSKPPGFTESLYTRQSFQEEFESTALKGATLSQLDLDVVLKYLERDVRVVVVEKNAVKFVDPADAEAIAEGITEVDYGVLEMKTTLQRLGEQISEIERQIQERLDKIGEHLKRGSKTIALSYLRSKKQLEELLAKRLNSQETLQTVLNKIESAATEVEIMKAYDTSARTLRAVLQNPLLQQESIEATMERMSDVLADHKEIEDAIKLGNDLAASSAGAPEADDEELKDELEMLIEEQRKEEEEEKEKERVRLEEKRKAEEKERRVREEAERKRERERKAKEEAEVSRREEEEVRRKLEEVHVSPAADPRKDWEKRYDEAQVEKTAQALRDREAELKTRERWEKERVAET